MAPAVLSKYLRDQVVQWRIEKNWSYRKLAELIGTVQATILMYHPFMDPQQILTNPFGQPRRPHLLDQDTTVIIKYLRAEIGWDSPHVTHAKKKIKCSVPNANGCKLKGDKDMRCEYWTRVCVYSTSAIFRETEVSLR